MKKRTILAALLALCMLMTGCQHDSSVTATPELFWEDGRLKMTINWVNNSLSTIEYGNGYSIQRLEGDEWVSCRYEPVNYATTSEAYVVRPFQSQKQTYFAGACHYFGLPGQYRLVTHYYTKNIDGSYESHEISTEFTIELSFLNQHRHTFDVAFTARSFSTPWTGDHIPNSPATAIYFTNQWESYILANGESYDFSSLDSLRSEYDDAFFQNHYVILVPVVGAQDSVDTEVQQLLGDSLGNHQVTLSRQYRGIGAGTWHILLEVEKPERSDFARGPYVEITAAKAP